MKKQLCFITVALVFVSFGCKQHRDKDFSQSTEVQAKEMDCPNDIKVFGDASFQTDIFRGSFASDGQTFYFFKKVTVGEEDYRIFQSDMVDGKWTAPQKLNLGGDYSDLYPSISKDGRRLVFSSYRPVPNRHKLPDSKNAHLWYVDKTDEGWGTPIFMANANAVGHYHSWVEFGWDDKIYFRRITPDWATKTTFFTTWNGSSYETPEVFEEVEQWKNWSDDIKIVGGSPGPTKNLIFLSIETYDYNTDERGSDIWVSVKRNEIWSEPMPLNEKVNQPGYDVFPFFSPDGNCLYFIRDFDRFYVIPLKEALSHGMDASN